MTKGQVIGGVIFTAGLAAVVYYGFIHKFEGNVTGWQKLMGGKGEEPKKEEATVPAATTTTTVPANIQTAHPANPPVVPPVVEPTPVAKTLSEKIDALGAKWVKAKYNNTPVYFINPVGPYKKYNKGKDIGRLGKNLKNGYHQITGTGASSDVQISDQYLKHIFGL